MVAFLPNLQYELVNPPNEPGGGMKFGRGTRIHVTNVNFAAPNIRTNDEPNPRGDGLRMGRDFYDGRLVTFDINIKTRPGDTETAAQLYTKLESAWFTEDAGPGPSRLIPGELSQLRMNRHGIAKTMYGRPRRIEAVTGRVDTSGWVPVTCDFQTADHRFYSDGENANTISIFPGNSGGFTFPFDFPLSTVPISAQDDIVVVDGTAETYLRTKIWGPIVNPEIEVVEYWRAKLNLTLTAFDYIEIDPRPWSRKILMNGTTNIAGKFTQDSRRVSLMTLPPGTHQVVLRGVDPTGTARMESRWQNVSTSW